MRRLARALLGSGVLLMAAAAQSTYTTNGDGTVTDASTGLMWQQSDGGEKKWEDSAGYCKSLNLANQKDWRLPRANELFQILKHDALNPALDTTVFTRTAAQYWWASEERADNPAMAWAVNAGGGAGAHPKSETVSAGGDRLYHVRCVRTVTPPKPLPQPYRDNGDGTVTDLRNGLMWQKSEGSPAATWEEALHYAAALELGGHKDWRLPDIKELFALNDVSAVRPSIASAFFPGTPPALYWSSTTQFNRPANAWTVNFNFGIASYNPKTQSLHVRAVRGPR